MIVLREYAQSDIDQLTDLANNRNVSRYLVDKFPYPYTKEDAAWWIETGSTENGSVTKAIEYKGKLVGSIGIRPQSGWKSHLAEIGYWIGEPYWGRGIAKEALRMMSKISMKELNFKKLYASVLAPNHISMHVLEKMGYSLEGVLKNEVKKNGIYYDIHHYAKSCL